jgi:AAA+ superfamily predicted ATPase
MASADDNLASLREAAALSPDNAPLRRLLAEALLAAGRPEEAEKEYRLALALDPDSGRLKVGLARAFQQQGKHSPALVVVEDLLRRPDTPAAAYLLHARLLLCSGEADRAVAQYRAALDADPALADPDLAQQLGLTLDAGHRRAVSGRPPRQTTAPPAEAAPPPLQVERPALTFADVGGLEAVKDELRLRLRQPQRRRELYAAYGKTPGGGVLLYGPPGCGKTLLARAAAGEAGAGLLAVGLDEALDLWLGRGGRELADLFTAARAAAPCVLFFDEADALAGRGADRRDGGRRSPVDGLLAELDEAGPADDGVLVLAATGAPWRLDPELLRPERFGRPLFVPPPDHDARAAVLRLRCRNALRDAVDFARVARRTEGLSGADLASVVERAVQRKLRDAVQDGAPRPLTTRDLLDAAETVRPSTPDWFAAARNYALYANDGGRYDEVLRYLKL